MSDAIILKDLKPEEVPERLRPSFYFDFDQYPFDHATLFAQKSLIDVIAAIDNYSVEWLRTTIASKASTDGLIRKTEADYPGRAYGSFVVIMEEDAVFEPAFVTGVTDGSAEPNTLYIASGTTITGTNIFLDCGNIYVGNDNIIEPGVGIKAPTIIGKSNEIRQGAYFRGDCIIGDDCTLRGELKNTVLMNKANFPHPSYLGDSLCGFDTHFGNQATSANLGILAILARDPIIIECDGKKYDLGRPKVGIIMGDKTQVGCNSVSDPGTFLAPWTIVYQLTRLNKGFYGPNEILKNKPMEHGVIERSPLRPK